MPIFAISFHHIIDPQDSIAFRGRTVPEFRSQIGALAASGRIVGPDELRRWLDGGSDIDNGFVLTFDDGLRSQVTRAVPILEEFGIRAFFFVPTIMWDGIVLDAHKLQIILSRMPRRRLVTAVEVVYPRNRTFDARARDQYVFDDASTAWVKYAVNFGMSAIDRSALLATLFAAEVGDEAALSRGLYFGPDDCRKLAGLGHEIGLHSHSHVPLSGLSREDVRIDLLENRGRLHSAVDREIRSIGYPFGTPDALAEHVYSEAAGVGADIGFTFTRAWIERGNDRLRLGRYDTNEAPGVKGGRNLLTNSARGATFD